MRTECMTKLAMEAADYEPYPAANPRVQELEDQVLELSRDGDMAIAKLVGERDAALKQLACTVDYIRELETNAARFGRIDRDFRVLVIIAAIGWCLAFWVPVVRAIAGWLR